jgi:hypothetical protein
MEHVAASRERAMACRDILLDCFDSSQQFASGPRARLKALEYLNCHLKSLDPWLEVREEILHYLRAKGASQDHIDRQLERAKKFLEPWLP